MIDELERYGLDAETAELAEFYDSVRRRVEGIDNAEGKQYVVVELYERFFKVAYPKVAESLGIVYTPVEIVDFIHPQRAGLVAPRVRHLAKCRGRSCSRPFRGNRDSSSPDYCRAPS